MPLLVRDEVDRPARRLPRARTRRSTENERRCSRALAAQLAVAVQNAQLHEQAKRARHASARRRSRPSARPRGGSRALYEISRSFAQSLSLETTLEAVARDGRRRARRRRGGDPHARRAPRARSTPRALHVADAAARASGAHDPLRAAQPFARSRGSSAAAPFRLDAEPSRALGARARAARPVPRAGVDRRGRAGRDAGRGARDAHASSRSTRRARSPTRRSTRRSRSPAQAALAIDNARLYQQQKEFADTMQRSLLPRAQPDDRRARGRRGLRVVGARRRRRRRLRLPAARRRPARGRARRRDRPRDRGDRRHGDGEVRLPLARARAPRAGRLPRRRERRRRRARSRPASSSRWRTSTVDSGTRRGRLRERRPSAAAARPAGRHASRPRGARARARHRRRVRRTRRCAPTFPAGATRRPLHRRRRRGAPRRRAVRRRAARRAARRRPRRCRAAELADAVARGLPRASRRRARRRLRGRRHQAHRVSCCGCVRRRGATVRVGASRRGCARAGEQRSPRSRRRAELGVDAVELDVLRAPTAALVLAHGPRGRRVAAARRRRSSASLSRAPGLLLDLKAGPRSGDRGARRRYGLVERTLRAEREPACAASPARGGAAFLPRALSYLDHCFSASRSAAGSRRRCAEGSRRCAGRAARGSRWVRSLEPERALAALDARTAELVAQPRGRRGCLRRTVPDRKAAMRLRATGIDAMIADDPRFLMESFPRRRVPVRRSFCVRCRLRARGVPRCRRRCLGRVARLPRHGHRQRYDRDRPPPRRTRCPQRPRRTRCRPRRRLSRSPAVIPSGVKSRARPSAGLRPRLRRAPSRPRSPGRSRSARKASTCSSARPRSARRRT